MSHTAYPTQSDLEEYLQDQGLDAGAVSARREAQAIASAISAFERAVDRKMLADTNPVARTFSPPETRNGLLFLPDFISLSSIIYQPADSSPETFTLATDYTLQPVGALTGAGDYAPYSAIAFRRYWPQPMSGDLQNSLTITARWGYAAAIPDDAWEAMLARAAVRLLVPVSAAVRGGLTSYKEADVSEEYEKGGPYASLLAPLNDLWTDAVAVYRRHTI